MDRPFIELRVGVVRAFDDNQLRAHALPAQGGRGEAYAAKLRAAGCR